MLCTLQCDPLCFFRLAGKHTQHRKWGDRAQSIINKRILQDCDLLVGVFWTRIGTATSGYASGTVEEIEEHIKAKKPAMLYFSEAPAVLDKVDPKQYDALKAFRGSCQPRGLYFPYKDLADFRKKFTDQLQIRLNTDAVFQSVVTAQGKHTDEPSSPAGETPELTAEAQMLLKEASQDPQGVITRMPMRGGLLVQTNGKSLAQDGSARTAAMWEGAIKELEELGFIETKGIKREIFTVTREGYNAARLLPG